MSPASQAAGDISEFKKGVQFFNVFYFGYRNKKYGKFCINFVCFFIKKHLQS